MATHAHPNSPVRVAPWVIFACLFMAMLTAVIIAAGVSQPHRSNSNVVVHSVSTAQATPKAPAPPPKVTVVAPKPSATFYVVRPGDNLTRISLRFHVPLRKLYRDNLKTVGSDWNLIYPGQRLKVIPDDRT